MKNRNKKVATGKLDVVTLLRAESRRQHIPAQRPHSPLRHAGKTDPVGRKAKHKGRGDE